MTSKLAILAAVTMLVPALAAADPAPHGLTCLWARDIDHSNTLDDSTIVFHMRDGAAWTNHLREKCSGLKVFGFRYVRQDDKLCDRTPVEVLRLHHVCQLGEFERTGGH